MSKEKKLPEYRLNCPNCSNDRFADLVWLYIENDPSLYYTCKEIFSKENFLEIANNGYTKRDFFRANSLLLSGVIRMMIMNEPDHPLCADLRNTLLAAINFEALAEKFFNEEIMEEEEN